MHISSLVVDAFVDYSDDVVYDLDVFFILILTSFGTLRISSIKFTMTAPQTL